MLDNALSSKHRSRMFSTYSAVTKYGRPTGLAFLRWCAHGKAPAGFQSFLAAAVLTSVLTSFTSSAQTLLYSSADFGGSFGGGQGISSSQWEGVRFQLNAPTTNGAIGGNIGVLQSGNDLLFGALIQLTSMSDLPDSLTLDTPDVLAHATFGGQNPSSDVVVPIAPVSIGPGVYGLVFGTGLFGATGQGFMTVGNPQSESPSLFGNFGGHWLNEASTTFRFTAYSVPEPGITGLLSLGTAFVVLRYRRRRIG